MPAALVDANGEITNVGKTAQTMAFAVLAMSQLTHVFNLRSNKKSIFKVGLLTNRTLIGATLISMLLMIIVLNVPFLQNIFEVTQLPLNDIELVTLLIISPVAIVELFKAFKINTLKDEE